MSFHQYRVETLMIVSEKIAQQVYPTLLAQHEAYREALAQDSELKPQRFKLPGYLTIENFLGITDLRVEPFKEEPVTRSLGKNTDSILAQKLINPNLATVKIVFSYMIGIS